MDSSGEQPLALPSWPRASAWLRQEWGRQEAGVGWLNPLNFSLGTRWFAWLIAAGIILLQAAPPANLSYGRALLAVTGLQLAVSQALLSRRIRGQLPGGLAKLAASHPLTCGLDVLASLAVVYVSGGWNSPFYEFSLTSVIAPSLVFGLRAATLTSLSYCLVYFWVLTRAGLGTANFVNPDGHLQGAVISCLVNPFMVAYFSAFLAKIMGRLKEEQQRVRVLAAREERHRLAREMHDGVAQMLFMLSLSLEASAEKARRQDQVPLAQQLEGLLVVAREALWEVRQSMLDLGPLVEGDTPLVDALNRLLREFKTVSSIPLELECQGREPSLGGDLKLGLYRVVQESLANACKHSKAEKVRVRLEWGSAQVDLRVEDDGVGFDPDQVERGRGLGNLNTRARELGARLSLDSAPGAGTRMHLELPIPSGGQP